MSKPETPPPPAYETDPRFPSGAWTGFYLQKERPGRQWMELDLNFVNGQIRGEGRDPIGNFIVRGLYTLEDGKCHWSKRYVGRHDVAYQGFNEGKGIWGTWEIPPYWKGGFHIWPEKYGQSGLPAISEAIEEPIEEPIAEEIEAGELVEVGAD
jgi:hypothetical protein